MTFRNISQIEKYLATHISQNPQKIFRGGKGLIKVKKVLKKIGEPQNKLKVIHLAGTSGKGSTANFAAEILIASGFKVGLHVSPHLLDVRERFQVSNKLISEQKFCRYFNNFFRLLSAQDEKDLSYFEILTIFSFYVFALEKVDYAVVETGLGGLYDATNVISSTNKIVILTKIGLDHTNILGKTIAKIAYQKAMITQKKNIVISIYQTKSAREVIEKIVRENQSKLFYIRKNINYFNFEQKIDRTIFSFKFDNFYLKDIELAMIGAHQSENCSLALAAVLILAKRDKFKIDLVKIKKTLKKVVFAGRMEIRKNKDKIIVLDGAHNPQKMSSLIKTLEMILPKEKFNFLVAFKRGKDVSKILGQIIPYASKIIITAFFQSNQDMKNFSFSPTEIANYLKKSGFSHFKIISEPQEAIEYLMAEDKNIVITGSLYLISEIYPLVKGVKK